MKESGMQYNNMPQKDCQHCDHHQRNRATHCSAQEKKEHSRYTSNTSGFEFSTYSQGTNDQSSQAMTEVALALSMAFFALFVLALISMGTTDENKTSQSAINNVEEVPEFVLVQSKKATISPAVQLEDTIEKQFVFYYEGVFYDQNIEPTSAGVLDLKKKLVVAMPIDTDVSKALSLQQEFAKFDVALTVMDDKWLLAFESSL
ncbi:MAG: hypothetical protein ACI97K_000492 [Glaciecola sp.]|jgi:hypothetical protein